MFVCLYCNIQTKKFCKPGGGRQFMTATYCVNLSLFPVLMPYCFSDLLIRLFHARFEK